MNLNGTNFTTILTLGQDHKTQIEPNMGKTKVN